MTDYPDKAMIGSNFERNDRDHYATEPWVTRALLNALHAEKLDHFTHIWEPACGRGDMVKALCDSHCFIAPSDIDLSLYEGEDGYQVDFLKTTRLPPLMRELIKDEKAIITNPPYNLAEKFVVHALDMNVGLVAMLFRGEWKFAKKRNYLFVKKHLNKDFAMEVVLTSRPRWDDWREKAKPDKSPRFSFSWLVWVDNWGKPPTIRWQGKSS